MFIFLVKFKNLHQNVGSDHLIIRIIELCWYDTVSVIYHTNCKRC